MSSPLLLDHGTQSVRALAFDLEGRLVARSRVPLTPYVSTQPGWAEQDPEDSWRSLCGACQGLWKEGLAPRWSPAWRSLKACQRQRKEGPQRHRGTEKRPISVSLCLGG